MRRAKNGVGVSWRQFCSASDKRTAYRGVLWWVGRFAKKSVAYSILVVKFIPNVRRILLEVPEV